MTPCALHGGISTTLCGCAASTLRPEARPDVHRDFSELPLGQRVRFAGKLREVETCPVCGLQGVCVEDARPRRWPFRKGDDVVEEKALRVTYVHDALVGPFGFIFGAACVRFERTKKR
jgi:hypothetical protein